MGSHSFCFWALVGAAVAVVVIWSLLGLQLLFAFAAIFGLVVVAGTLAMLAWEVHPGLGIFVGVWALAGVLWVALKVVDWAAPGFQLYGGDRP